MTASTKSAFVRRSAVVASMMLVSMSSSSAARAQQGYLSIMAKLPGEAHANRLPNHVFFSEGGTLVDRPDGAFSPGAHTIARLEVGVNGCTAVATNVGFTIVAGELTKITPQVTLESCFIQASPASDYDGYGEVKVIRTTGQTVIDCHLLRLTSGLVVMDHWSECSTTLPYGEAYTVRITRGNDHITIVGIGCDQEDEAANTYVCAYKADTTYAERIRQIRFSTDDVASPRTPSADLEVTLRGTVQSGLGTISKFRVTNHGPDVTNATFGITGEIPGPHDSYSLSAGGFDAGPCYDRCEFRIASGESIDWFVRTVPSFQELSNGTFVLPADSRYCQEGYAFVFDAANGINAGAIDPNLANNSTPCVSSDVQVTVTAGTNTPPNQTVAAGAASVAMLQFALDPPSPTTLDNITLTASGSGNEHVDVTAVKLYVDANANGVADAGETLLGSGTFADNDGSVTLAVAPPYTVSGPTSFLVTYDFNTTLASRYGGVIVLAGLLPLFFVPRRRRRGAAGLILLIGAFGITSIGLGACGGDSTGPNPPPGGSATYSVTLTGATVGGTAVSNVSVQGATVTIAK